MPDEQVNEQNETHAPLTDGKALHRANEQQARAKRLERFRSGDSSLMGSVHKMCCQCGTDLNHRPRFKDSSGRYWCPHCNDADHEKRRPAPCADCGVEMLREQMISARGMILCPVCADKRHSPGIGVAPSMHVRPVLVASTSDSQALRIAFGLIALLIAVIVVAYVLIRY